MTRLSVRFAAPGRASKELESSQVGDMQFVNKVDLAVRWKGRWRDGHRHFDRDSERTVRCRGSSSRVRRLWRLCDCRGARQFERQFRSALCPGAFELCLVLAY